MKVPPVHIRPQPAQTLFDIIRRMNGFEGIALSQKLLRAMEEKAREKAMEPPAPDRLTENLPTAGRFLDIKV